MNPWRFWTGILWLAVAAGCAHGPGPLQATRQVGESVVFIGQEPARLLLPHASRTGVEVRSTYLPGPGTIVYHEGRDYALDRQTATLRRLPGSRLPDFRTNVLYGQEDFDHSKFPGFGNTAFFAFVDYQGRGPAPGGSNHTAFRGLERTRARLVAGGEFRLVAFGDSITAGGDATRPEWIFWRRWADHLQARHPAARIVAVNGATGGDSTVQGLARLQAKVLDQQPHLVLIGFGMNDHNRGGVPIPDFEANLRGLIQRIREGTAAEIVLFNAFPPNPRWKFGSHRMEEYAAATARVAEAERVAFVDVYSRWQSVAARKKPEDLLGNNINHPNDFGHALYFEAFRELGL